MKLSRPQIEQLFNVTGQSHDGKYLLGTCPQCHQNEFYLLLNEENHPCGCSRGNACGWKGNVWGLAKLTAKKLYQEKETNIFDKLEIDFGEHKKELNLELPTIKPPLLWKRIYESDYLISRGFTPEQFEKHKVGISKLRPDYITFLVERDQEIVGYVSRSTRSKEWIDNYNKKQKEQGSKNIYLRYDNSGGDFSSRTLFGIDEVIPEVTTDVILVEGIFSKTKTDTNLCLDFLDELKCLATFGSKLSPEQRELLKQKGVKTLWFWFEADVLEKIKHIVAEAALEFDVKVSYLNGKDPNDIDPEEAQELLDNAKNYFDFNMSYLNVNFK